MPYLNLAPPDWDAVLGGSEIESRWIADRDRKFELIVEKAERFLKLGGQLAERDALFTPTFEVLRSYPDAADWYLCLTGIALNTLQYLREGPANFGMSRRAATVRKNLVEGRGVSDADVCAYSEWLKTEIDQLYSEDRRTPKLASAVVFGMLGARAVGQGQNRGGDDGVILLKRQLVAAFAKRGHPVAIDLGAGYASLEPAQKLQDATLIRFAKRIECDFRGGGNRPDIQIRDGGVVIANGEVKARKDVSNTWESWMPQIVDHMRTWAGDSPDAARLFFGTLVTEGMIEGTSHRGVRRSGLKNLHANGLLTNAYNISKIAAGDSAAVGTFSRLVVAIEERLDR